MRVTTSTPKKSESRPRRPKNPVTTSTPKKSSHDLDSQKSKSARDAHFSQNLFRLNLDASRVPEALVNSFRLLPQLRTRLNPPDPQSPSNNKSQHFFSQLDSFSITPLILTSLEEQVEVADSENRTPDSKFPPVSQIFLPPKK